MATAVATTKPKQPTLRERALKRGMDPNSIPSVSEDRANMIELESLQAKIISSEDVFLTVEKAEEYINLPMFEAERDITDAHVDFLLREMESGRFNWDAVTIASAYLGEDRYKINGQHTCWARIGLPDNVKPKVREIIYRVTTESQLKALYSTFDRAKPRSDVHLTHIELAGSAAVAGLTKAVVKKLTPGFKFWRLPSREDQRKIRPAELSKMIMSEYPDLFNSVGMFYDGLDKVAGPLLNRQPVFAAMLETFHRAKTIAPDFWTSVGEGTNLSKGDARWVLRNYLENSALSKNGVGVSKNVVDPEQMYRICINGWNKWRTGETVHQLKTTQKRVRAN